MLFEKYTIDYKNQMGWPYQSFDCVFYYLDQFPLDFDNITSLTVYKKISIWDSPTFFLFTLQKISQFFFKETAYTKKLQHLAHL